MQNAIQLQHNIGLQASQAIVKKQATLKIAMFISIIALVIVAVNF